MPLSTPAVSSCLPTGTEEQGTVNPPGSSWGSEELFPFELVEESGGRFGRHGWESGRETECSLISVSPGSR
jgi:hypothetical protein